MSPPEKLLCTICQDICKRASKIPCCGAQCCWGCGVRSITRSRKCWNCPNITVVTGDLVKDTELREDINNYNQATRKAEILSAEGQTANIQSTGAVEEQEKFVEKCSESLEIKSSQLNQIVKNASNSVSEEVELNISKEGDSNYSDKLGEVTTDDEVLPSSRVENHIAEFPSASDFHQNSLVSPAQVNVEEELVDNRTVVKEHDKEVDPPIVSESEDNFDINLQIGEFTSPCRTDITDLNKEIRTVTEVPESVTESREHSKPVCDPNIPNESEKLIHPEETSSSKTSPVKIDLKGSFKKLTDKVKLLDSANSQGEADLEMFEKNLSTEASTSVGANEEVRIVKMVEDLDKKEKIVRIIEELDKTKSLSKRRKSSDILGSDKRSSPPKAEVVPITNALQGLQALLKMSKISDTTNIGSKETDSAITDKKSDRSRNTSATSLKSSHVTETEQRPRSRRRSDSHERSKKTDVKSRRGDHKESKSRINRSALVRDKLVETHTKSLVEEQNNKNVVESLQAVSIVTSGPTHDCHEPGRSKNKFQSFQMKDIRKRLLPGPRSTNTISSRANEVAKRKGKEEEDEVKVLSYRMVKPKVENEENIERIVRKVEDANSLPKIGKCKSEFSRNMDGVTDKASRKVKEVPKVIEVCGDTLTQDTAKIEEKAGHRSINTEASINLFQKSIVNIQSQENAENPNTNPEGRNSLDLIKEELERVTSKVNNIKKKSTPKEISSDDDMKVIMKDVEEMEEDVNEIIEEVEDGRRSKSKKKKHKEDKKKKKKSKYTGDIAIDSRIAKKIISRIISSDMGKSFNDAIKQEVGETESTIEKLREDLRKKSSQDNKSKKKNKKDKSKEGKERKKKKKDKYGDEENPRDLNDEKKKKKSKERSVSYSEEVEDSAECQKRKDGLCKVDESKTDRSSHSKNNKKRKSSSPVRFYDQVPSVDQEIVKNCHLLVEDRKSKKVKHDDEKRDHKKKKSKKKHKRNKEREDMADAVVNSVTGNEVSAVVESKIDNPERIVRKRSSSPSHDFDLVLGVAEEDLVDESISNNVNKTNDAPDSVTETEVDTTIDSTIDDNDENSNATVATKQVPELSTEVNTSISNSGATSSANSDTEEQSEDEDNLRALLLSQLSKTRCGPKTKSEKKVLTKISWSSPTPEPVEVSSTTPSVPTMPSYPPMGSLPVYAYAYSRTFITPAEKLLYFPNLYNRILVPLEPESDSDSDCESDCDAFWAEKRTSQWVSERLTHTQGFSEADPRYSQANLNLVMRGRESCSPAPN